MRYDPLDGSLEPKNGPTESRLRSLCESGRRERQEPEGPGHGLGLSTQTENVIVNLG